MDRTNLIAHINFNGQEWQAIKRWLQEQKDLEVNKLIKATTHDESNGYRGAIRKLDQLLNAEKDAAMASQQVHNK
jgi:hypothetical protein